MLGERLEVPGWTEQLFTKTAGVLASWDLIADVTPETRGH
jgi:hypothetical protein